VRSRSTRSRWSRSGSYPFGWSKGGQVEREQHVLSVIKTRLPQGRNLAVIAAYLNSRPGHHPRHGERWTRQTFAGVASKARHHAEQDRQESDS
jgi:hypothetical protein